MANTNGANDLAPYGDPLKHWKPAHDQVISLYMAGYSNEAISAHTEFSVGHVRRILHDPRAQRALVAARERMLGKFMSRISDQMVVLGVEAIQNIAETITEKVEVGTHAKKHQDAVSFELLGRIGYGRKDNGEGKGSGGINLTPEGEARFLAAVEKSDHAREINATVVEAEIVDD